jgi:magnesium chelatase family protein
MLAKVMSGTVVGVDGFLVEVEVDIAIGLPTFSTVGLPEGAVRESKDRVKAAIKNSGYEFPNRRITVNLAPADVKKGGTGYDLPIALGILAASGCFPREKLKGFTVIGELSLDGGVRSTAGILPMILAARKAGFQAVLLPSANIHEASMVEGIKVFGIKALYEAVDFLAGKKELEPVPLELRQQDEAVEYDLDFSDVKGQEHVKRALEIAAAGRHNILMTGPPGSGKTMMARCLPTILPPLSFEESLETTKIYSVMGLLAEGRGLITVRPFRAPHHTISDAGLIGGGQTPRPGEVSLAHNGVLFLDELPEFKKNVLEVLRQPLEDREVTIARASLSLSFPADIMLVAAMNPCPCSFLGSTKECTCTLAQIQKYQYRLSGPLLDRIDMHLEVPVVPFEKLSSTKEGEPSRLIQQRVAETQAIQRRRFTLRKNVFFNSQMLPRDIRHHCALDPASTRLLEKAVTQLNLSARAHQRILKISRTIADLAGYPAIAHEHLAEAVQYRRLNLKS